MTKSDITNVFAYRREKLPHLDKRARSYNYAASHAIVEGFMAYGWSRDGLLDSHTKVMETLKLYLHKRPHANDLPGDFESKNKRPRVD